MFYHYQFYILIISLFNMFLSLESSILEILVLSYDFYDFGFRSNQGGNDLVLNWNSLRLGF